MSRGSELNRRLKGWPGWVALGVVVVVALTIGATRDSGPQTQSDRIDSITQRLACPICDGESVYESRNNASEGIRNLVAELVRENDLSDAEIIGVVETRFGAKVLLVPRASGFDALVWVLPAIAFVGGIALLAVAFRRWRVDASSIPDPTEADRELVAAALAAEHGGFDVEPLRPPTETALADERDLPKTAGSISQTPGDPGTTVVGPAS